MISVCVATFNGGKYIKTQIESILKQLGENDEVIVSDDNSSDDTIEILKDLNDNRIKIYTHNPNLSLKKMKLGSYRLVADNFQNSLKYAHGDYIFLSDQDDIWCEGRIIKTLEALKKNKVVLCNFSIINNYGIITKSKEYNDSNVPVKNSFLYNITKCRFMCCCMAFSRDVLKYALPFPKKLMSCDQWIGNMATLLGNCKYISEPLHLYRRHGNNVSETTEKSKNSFIFKLYFRLYIFTLVLFRFLKCKIKGIK